MGLFGRRGGAAERAWGEPASTHVTTLLEASPGLDDLTDDQLDRMTHLCLVEEGAVPAGWHPSASAFAPGIVALPVVDLPDSVSTPAETQWIERGGVERWRARGLANLRLLVDDDSISLDHLGDGGDDEDGASITCLMGESLFTASLALLLPEVLRVRTGESDLGRGVLVVLPNRHQLAWHVVTGTESPMLVNALVGLAMSGFEQGGGPLSPHLYWVRGTDWRQVTQIADDRVGVEIDEDLGWALGMIEE